MFFKNLIQSGWLHAVFIAVIAYPMASMTQKFVASYTDANLLAYTAVFMLCSSISLLVIAGPGELANATLKRFETWLYAFLQIFSYILFLYSVLYASATQAAALTMIGGLFILIFSIMFLRQPTNRYEVLGSVVMVYGLFLIIAESNLSLEHKAILTFIVVLRGLVISFQKIITEIHKTNRKATSFKSQMRVTGFIMAVASFVYLIFLLVMAYIKQQHDIAFLKPFPYYSDFANFDMFIFSMFVGFIVVSSSKYCEFYAGKSIGAKYLTAITSLQIVFVYGLEIFLSKLNLVEHTEVDHSIIGALALILLGNFVISLAGFIKDIKFIKLGEKQDTLANLEDNYIDNEQDYKLVRLNISNLLALYDDNIEKLSQDLNLEVSKLEEVQDNDFVEGLLHSKTARIINNFASKNVAIKDQLTKAYNRYYLQHKAEEMFMKNMDFKVYYLDLNKFKPVNDKYGHDAGDYVLAQVVERLNSINYFKESVYRIGGDEFILIQTLDLDLDLTSLILQKVEQNICLPEPQEDICISTSVGVVASINCNDIEDMLNQADHLMYKDKNKK